MKITPLIGCHLKSDEIIELLELWSADVVYDFDRLHENVPDTYHVAAKDAGVELIFDDKQLLTTIFLYLQAGGGFAPFNLSQFEIPSFATVEDAQQFAVQEEIPAVTGKTFFLNEHRNWIKLNYGSHSIHYEFRNDRLGLITVSRLNRSESWDT